MFKQDKILILFFIFIIVTSSIIPVQAIDIPPTPAFSKVHSDNGTITALNYSMPLNIKGGNGIAIKSNNSTHTLTISSNTTSNLGSYNTTQANNVNENVGGNAINFENGSGTTIIIKNSHGGKQVNVTISSTGSGGTITGSGSINQMTYWTGISSVGGATNMIWDNTNNVLKGLSDVTTSLGTSSLKFLNIFASVINGTTVRANTFTASTGSTITATNNINIGANKLQTNNFDYYEKVALGQFSESLIPSSGIGGVFTIGTGANSVGALQISSTTDIATNYLGLRLDNGISNPNAWTISSFKGGNATLIPLFIQVGGTNRLSFDTPNTITSYVNHSMKGLITTYNNIATSGMGVSPIYNSTKLLISGTPAQTILTYTVPAASGQEFRINFAWDIKTVNTGSGLGWTLTYTDGNKVLVSAKAQPLIQQGTAAPALTYAANGNYYGTAIINTDTTDGTKIIVAITGTGSITTSTVTASIEQIS